MKKQYETPKMNIMTMEHPPMLTMTSNGAQNNSVNLNAHSSNNTVSGSSALGKQRDTSESTGGIDWDLDF